MTENAPLSAPAANEGRFGWIIAAAWLFAIYFGLTGILVIYAGHFFVGVLDLAASCVIFPPLVRFVEHRTHFFVSGWVRIGAAIALLVAAYTVPHFQGPTGHVSRVAESCVRDFIGQHQGEVRDLSISDYENIPLSDPDALNGVTYRSRFHTHFVMRLPGGGMLTPQNEWQPADLRMEATIKNGVLNIEYAAVDLVIVTGPYWKCEEQE